MRANPSRDTEPERRLRAVLHARGYRFRANLRVEAYGLRVRPDIVFTRHRLVVFVDGCFWHSCPTHGNSPRVNTGYWLPKLTRVLERDRRADDLLSKAGWTVMRVWEHERLDVAADQIVAALLRLRLA
jgi:DNA mismatch endonuclease, patch repair protein